MLIYYIIYSLFLLVRYIFKYFNIAQRYREQGPSFGLHKKEHLHDARRVKKNCFLNQAQFQLKFNVENRKAV